MLTTALPQLRLNVDAMDRNIARMAHWCEQHLVELAPHVKTTMSPQVVRRQLTAGARGVTVATTHQATLAASWGAEEILIANEVVGTARLREIRDGRHLRDRTVRIFVDSLDGVAVAAAVHTDPATRLGVLIDVGTRHRGRTGVRSRAEAFAVAEAVSAAPGLRLDGVAGYEGVVANDRSATTVAKVDEHCTFVRSVFEALREHFETSRPIYSMGGSAYPDRVVRALPEQDREDVRILLRSGCYVTHDHGTYANVSPILELEPALRVRALVTSHPEPGLAILNAGKRDLPYDAGLPVVLQTHRNDRESPATIDATVRTLYDHHAVITGEVEELRIGDTVDLGISHPCSAFDRWPEYLAVDDAGTPRAIWTTDFRRCSR